MEYLPGFKWAVPKAFSDAVAACCFEEGDVLYDTPLAYEVTWEEAKDKIEYYLQVKYPARGNSQASSQSGVFASNWESEVRLDLYKNHSKVSTGQIHTTQGRLYSALWKGDIGLLTDKNYAASLPPRGVREVTKSLDSVSHEANNLGKGSPVFVMVKDITNQIAREKYQAVKDKLYSVTVGEPILKTPEESGMEDSSNISPTIQIAYFITNLTSATDLESLVKEAVYSPVKDSKKDMFRIAVHGRVYPNIQERHFIYQDAKGNITERNVYSVTESEQYIQGICRKSNAIKTFKKDRVLEYILDPAISSNRLDYFISNNPEPIKSTKSPEMMDICFTGFKKRDKEHLAELAKNNSLNVRSSVTEGLSFLCCGYNAGPKKMEAARKQGALVLSEIQFKAMLETGELPEEFHG